MSLKNTNESYGKLTVILHWLMAAMIIGLVAAGFLMDMMEKGDLRSFVVTSHKATGFVVIFLGLFRWYWMITNQSPSPLASLTKAEIGISHATKWLLMLLLLVMPISGMLMSMFHGYGINFYGLFNIAPFVAENKDIGKVFGSIHEIGAYAISIVIGLHVIAAIRHHFIKKDDTLNRILGRK